MNKIVARYADGNVVKGFTSDFSPGKRLFHVTRRDDNDVEVIMVEKLKAVFIVKEFDGNPNYKDIDDFSQSGNVYGSRMKVIFKDGEEMVGIGMGYKPEKVGFFMTPCDPKSNIIRAFIVNDFVDHIERIK